LEELKASTNTGVVPMSTTFMHWDILVEMTGQERTIAILGFGFYNPTGQLVIPATLVPFNETTPLRVTRIANNAFATEGQFSSVVIPANVTQIGQNAFRNRTLLTSVTFNNGLLTIGANAFENTRISSVDVPNTVTSIGARAFAANSALNTVRFRGRTPQVSFFGATVFASSNNIGTLQVPLGSMQVYRERLAVIGLTVSLNGTRNRIVGICVQNNNVISNCTCCAFRIGDTNGNVNVDVNDALLILNYLEGASNAHIIRNSADARNAALILPPSRNAAQPRLQDAQDILRSTTGLCSWVTRTQCSRPTCNCTQ
jgi:hypothetical protein